MSLPTPLPFGLRAVKLTPYTTEAATALGTGVTLPHSRTLSFAEVEEYEELRGDDSLVATHGSGPSVEWELESGGIPFEAGAVMYGGTVSSSGVTPNIIKTWTKRHQDVRKPFKIEGQVISDSGGDLHAVIYRAKATGNLQGEFGDGQFFLTGASGVGMKSNNATDISSGNAKVWDFVQNETVTAIA